VTVPRRSVLGIRAFKPFQFPRLAAAAILLLAFAKELREGAFTSMAKLVSFAEESGFALLVCAFYDRPVEEKACQ